MSLLGTLFEKMKGLGIYDQSLIIIAGDHGHFMGYYHPANYTGVEDFRGFVQGGNFRPATMYNPAVLIKPPSAAAGGVSHAAVGLTDVRSIIAEYLLSGRVDPKPIIAKRREQSGLPVAICTHEVDAYSSAACHQIVTTSGNVSTLPAIFEGLGTSVREASP
jgi:hypothetical protein